MPQCLQLSLADLAALVAAGAVIVGGPFPTQQTCVANCGPSSSLSPVGPSSSLSPAGPTSSRSSLASFVPIPTDCCPGGISSSLHATLIGAGDCSCVDGSYPIVQGSDPFGTGPGWAYSGTACSFNLFLFMKCNTSGVTGWTFQISLGPGGFGSPLNSNPIAFGDAGSTCNSPTNLIFNISGLVCVTLGMAQNVAVTVTL